VAATTVIGVHTHTFSFKNSNYLNANGCNLTNSFDLCNGPTV